MASRSSNGVFGGFRIAAALHPGKTRRVPGATKTIIFLGPAAPGSLQTTIFVDPAPPSLSQRPPGAAGIHFLWILRYLHASGPHRWHNSSAAPLACLRSCLALNRREPNSLPQPVQRYRSGSPALRPLSAQAVQVARRSKYKAFLKTHSEKLPRVSS